MTSPPDRAAETIAYHYRFDFGDGVHRDFDIQLRADTLELVPTGCGSPAPWTVLGFFRCPNCPLKAPPVVHCPIAASLAGLVNQLGDAVSYEETTVVIETQSRQYAKQTSVQVGAGSLVGLLMVTAGCPIMDKLRPMACCHLPFATLKETAYRVLSMYLLAQYFVQKQGGEPDWQLKGLVTVYEDVQTVNKHFAQRIRNAARQDASLNALVKLDSFAHYVSLMLEDGTLDELEPVFAPYLNRYGPAPSP